jgi:hypothetical protein
MMPKEDLTSPNGLLHCMRMLADEASSMQLTLTLAALQQAMETCKVEAIIREHTRSTAVH